MNDKQLLPKTALHFVLLGLAPYTDAGLKLEFEPNTFFKDLEKISRKSKAALKLAFNRAVLDGYLYVNADGVPRLTLHGLSSISPFIAESLGKDLLLLVIFSIPEEHAWKRQHLRRLLNYLGFEQIQRSVWATNMDYRQVVREEINELGLRNYVQVMEAVRLSV